MLKLRTEFRVQILRLLNSSEFYSEPFRDAQTPLNTFILLFGDWITHCSVHFAPRMQWTWFLGIQLLPLTFAGHLPVENAYPTRMPTRLESCLRKGR